MRALKWIAGIFAVVFLAGVLFIFFGLNALRGPIARGVEKATGRELRIEGSIRPVWSWVHPRFRVDRVTFANPDWAKQKYMVQADSVVLSAELFPLLIGRIVIPEIHLEHPIVDLEVDASGRKNWILKQDSQKKQSRVHIRRLTLDRGALVYDDAPRAIDLKIDLATDATGVAFKAQGKYAGAPALGSGHGGPVLAMRDDSGQPYPLKADAKIGDTAASVDGQITSFIDLSGIDMKVKLSGKTMEQLYDILHVAFPHTSPYTTSGHLVRNGTSVRYENFTGKVGDSDLAGTLEVDTSGERPFMRGDLVSKVLDLADLGPVVGTQKTTKTGVLPDAPFDAKRWKSVNADVKLRAGKIERPKQLPLENLSTRIRMQDAVLTLDPLEFGVAGGRLIGPIRLDGREGTLITADAHIRVDKLQLSKLFPTLKVTKASVGAMSGAIELKGHGNSVAQMLGSSNGKIGVYVNGGEVNEFIMQAAAMDLWGVAKAAAKGRDEQVPIRCVVGDWGVKDGVMQTNALVFDTQVVNIGGSGDINLKKEQLDLTFLPEPKDKSLASLNSPLYVRGTFSHPEVRPDLKKMAVKGAGALIMGILNPLLAVIPLVNEGPGKDSNCGKLIAEATSKTRAAATSGDPSSTRSASSGASASRPHGKSAR